ncbi:AAA family ATPase [Methylomonas albis]|uniref:AAA family ATPase n=1 Tax=Methylomonas albis TaxID=1854563 RepID=A0ABR9D6P0_9GAMM|nr:AAA family ATPase [Methylomonas albis]MBD9358768.1 AAA family ATPase [Methylomonas albis]
MKLLNLTLDGSYKGLSNQSFDFSVADGNVIAFVGLNGSGKSQLLELIAEFFAYVERALRKDFKVRKSFPFTVSVEYELRSFHAVEPNLIYVYRITIHKSGNIALHIYDRSNGWKEWGFDNAVIPMHVVGYSSGLNENIQRSFLKNAVQYFDVMKVRADRRQRLAAKLDERGIANINRFYAARYSGIFDKSLSSDDSDLDYQSLIEKDTRLPANIFLDYDCNALLMASLSILDKDELKSLFSEIPYCYPQSFTIQYDLRKVPIEQDSISDIRQLIRIAGPDSLDGIGRRTSNNEYELYELPYLTGNIIFDFSKPGLLEKLRENYYSEPLSFFEKIYKLQLLGVKNWQSSDKKNLRNDTFDGNVKKPLKTKLPLSVIQLKLSDGRKCIDFDDLSDGEAQLIQTIGAARVFRDEPTLFLFDEPETHLNPAWRTNFHKHLSLALNKPNQQNQAIQMLLSTHSPFLVSSLQNENVFRFERMDDGSIIMDSVTSQTYGASFEVLIKQFFGLKSLISQTAVDEIKKHLEAGDDSAARQWIVENIGDSMEKAYLLRKLKV